MEALFSPTLALHAPGFVCTSLLHGPVTAQIGLLICRIAVDSQFYDTQGLNGETRRDLSALSLWHMKESPPDASVKVGRPTGARWPGLFSALLLSGPATLAKGLNFPRTLGSACVIEG